MARDRFGIRFRVSLVLLLGVLNGVAMAALAIVLFQAVADSPPGADLAAVVAARAAVDSTHDAVLTATPGGAPSAEGTRMSMDAAQAALAAMSVPQPGLVADLNAYRTALEDWQAAREARQAATPAADAVLEARLGELKLAHHHLSGSMQLAVTSPRPLWVERALPLLPWGMAWVVLFAGITVGLAWSLRMALSEPLEELSSAARAVSEGRLDVVIPTPDDPPEIASLARAMGMARDNLVAAIREREARAAREQAILTHMSDGVLLCDETGAILQLNPKAEQLLWLLLPAGREPGLGGPVGSLIEELADDALDVIRHAGPGPTEITAHRQRAGAQGLRADDPKGGHVFVSITVRPVPSGRDPEGSGFVVVLRDVTAERTLDQLQREFLSVVTHELKTPLTAIAGYAKLLVSGKAGPLPERAEGFAHTILDQSQVLRTMVQNLLDTSRIENGTLPMHPELVDLQACVDELGRTWAGGVQTHGLAFEVAAEGLAGRQLRVDRTRLGQVVGNLINNAIEHTPAGGSIRLAARADDGDALIEITDDGPGIAADKLAHIFDKFYQVDRGDTRAAGGAGLGLFICRQLVDAMGGAISVRSEVGVGSTFSVRLPLVQAPPQGAAT
ncbi:MAG: HAMP domain-containing protein [Alphaproteobacteria bacterium]|nr:HAMP domain-containing protein [Alphaproteobacteria bacterium]